jgi:hypothetical protein
MESKPGAANYTIADYIKDNKIGETPQHHGDPGSPDIAVQLPDGWESAGDDKPDYAYGALVYKGSSNSNYTANIIALVSKLDGNVDQQKLLSAAGGEMKNLPGFVPAGEETGQVAGYSAYRIAGTYDLQGTKAASGQETIVIPTSTGLFVMQLNATSDASDSDALFTALETIDKSIAIKD